MQLIFGIVDVKPKHPGKKIARKPPWLMSNGSEFVLPMVVFPAQPLVTVHPSAPEGRDGGGHARRHISVSLLGHYGRRQRLKCFSKLLQASSPRSGHPPTGKGLGKDQG